MSVHFMFVRYVVEFDNEPFLDGSDTHYYWKTMTTGWKSGSRTRVRHFSSHREVFAYLNKLLAHGWTGEGDYSTAWCQVLDLCQRLEIPV